MPIRMTKPKKTEKCKQNITLISIVLKPKNNVILETCVSAS